jgi:hypothetical protein
MGLSWEYQRSSVGMKFVPRNRLMFGLSATTARVSPVASPGITAGKSQAIARKGGNDLPWATVVSHGIKIIAPYQGRKELIDAVKCWIGSAPGTPFIAPSGVCKRKRGVRGSTVIIHEFGLFSNDNLTADRRLPRGY